jgi:exopolysaccharide biosynthesis polyprenyl glycosylphosphotransferase
LWRDGTLCDESFSPEQERDDATSGVSIRRAVSALPAAAASATPAVPAQGQATARRRRRANPGWFIPLHAVIVAGVLFGTQYVITGGFPGLPAYSRAAPLVTAIFVGAFGYHLMYEREPYDTFTQALRVVARATVAGMIGSMAAIYIFGAIGYPRSALLLAFPTILLAVFAAEVVRLRYRLRHAPPRRAVVLGPESVSQPIVDHFAMQPTASLAVVDRLDTLEIATRLVGEDVPYDLMLIPGPGQLSHTPSRLLLAARSRGVRIFMLAGESGAFLGLSELHELGGLPWHELHVQSLPAARRAAKRVLDLGISLIALPFALLVGLGIAVAVRVDSRGPVLHRQRRSGLGGNDFTMMKFRTMAPDAEAGDRARLAAADDERVTRVGRVLRRHRLDELPQLLNVFRGDMSLVGPRPERPEFVASFQQEVPDYGERHAIRPGITGLAQVLGGYDTPAEHKVRFDILYVANWSMWLDMQILMKTAVVMLRGTGSR